MRKKKSYKGYIKEWKDYLVRQKDVKVIDNSITTTNTRNNLRLGSSTTWVNFNGR